MNIEFIKVSDFNRGILFDLLKDAYCIHLTVNMNKHAILMAGK